MNFGRILKQLREENGITQQQLADHLDVGRSTIAGYETKNKEPDFKRLNKIADYFNVSIDYLLGRTNIKNPPKNESTFAKDEEKENLDDNIDLDNIKIAAHDEGGKFDGNSTEIKQLKELIRWNIVWKIFCINVHKKYLSFCS